MQPIFDKDKTVTQIIALTFLIVFAILNSTYLSVDSENYRYAFDFYNETSWDLFLSQLHEIEFFYLLISKLYPHDQYLYIFSIIGLLSVSLKWYLMRQTSRIFTVSLLFYFSYFFILLDGTQIRVSLAIAIAFWGIYLWIEKKHFYGICLLLLASLFFHYSLFAILPLLLLTSKKHTKYLIASWFFLVILWYFGFSFISFLQSVITLIDKETIGISKITLYLSRHDPNSYPYSLQFLLLFFASIFVFFKYQSDLTDFEIICFNSVFVSFLILVIFTGESVLQNRLSEIFRFALVFISPLYYKFLVDYLPKKWQANLVLALALIGYFSYYILRTGMINFKNLSLI